MIELKNVSFSYKNQQKEAGLNDINLTIQKGETVLLCGESGCGKTTITRLINGLIPHYYEGELTGEVRIDGKKMNEIPLYETASFVGSVFQNPRSQFFHVDTTGELIFACENLGMKETQIRERLENTVSQLQLKEYLNRNIFQLSGGEKQRIACGSVSMLSPDIVVLDEPSSNLDFFAMSYLRDMIQIWRQLGKTIIIAEHRFHYLTDLLDKVVYMKNKKIVYYLSGSKFFSLSDTRLHELGLRGVQLQGMKKESKVKEKNTGFVLMKDFKFSYLKGADKKEALRIENERLPENKIIAIIGHNGAGKTTLLRCLCGLEKRCKGALFYGETKWKRRDRIKNCYLVMQDVNHQLFTESVMDEVILSMDIENEKSAKDILKDMNMLSYKDMHPLSLSGGQKQRVAICSALASNRRILIFDEPTSGLDYKHMKMTTENILKLQKEDKTIFIVTHDPEFILGCCNYILHMEEGKIIDRYALDTIGIQKLLSFFQIVPKSIIEDKTKRKKDADAV